MRERAATVQESRLTGAKRHLEAIPSSYMSEGSSPSLGTEVVHSLGVVNFHG